MATFGYARISTAEQALANQRLEIEKAGYVIDDEYWFADTVSGKVPAIQRPQFAAMLAKMRKGERLVVSRLDRLGRDAADVLATVKLLATSKIEVIVLQLGKVDLASSAGKLLMTMLAAVAEMERDLLVERTQAGLARARAEGKVLGRPPKTTARQRDDIVRKYENGATISSLAREYGVSRATILSTVKPDDVARQMKIATKIMRDDAGILKALSRT